HDFVAGTVTAPTCTAQGYTTFNCSRCSETKQDAFVAASGHSFTHYESDGNATCTADGTQTATCDNCTATDTKTENALGHDYKTLSGTPPTCTTGGSGTEECSRCHDIKVTTNAPALGHDYNEKVTAPTCTEAGYTTHTCSRCNDSYTDTQVSATGHTAGAEATCTAAQTCSVCGAELAAALGHDWSTEWSKDTSGHWHECTRCDEKSGNAEHTYEWVITKQPTKEETGLKENVCTVCGDKNGEEEIAKLVSDNNGNVSDLPVLPPDQNYDLEIDVKESDSVYNIAGVSRGYKVELYVVDGDNRTPYDNTKTVTLMLVIPDGMDEFTLYKMSGDRLTEVSVEEYVTDGRTVTIRTTIPAEFVFNTAEAVETAKSGIPWWVWLLVGLGGATLITVIIVAVVL
ncbi:MAG: hypothetical protein K2J54_02885, partial [Clostridia bacterium]|nr:hypothetical protein [Clostridia bacterium]